MTILISYPIHELKVFTHKNSFKVVGANIKCPPFACVVGVLVLSIYYGHTHTHNKHFFKKKHCSFSLWPPQGSTSSRPVPRTTSTWTRSLTAWWTPSARRWTTIPTETPLRQPVTRDPTWTRRPPPASVAVHASWQHTPRRARKTHTRARARRQTRTLPYVPAAEAPMLGFHLLRRIVSHLPSSFEKTFQAEMPKSWERTSVPSAPNLCFSFKCATINLLPPWARLHAPD